MRATTWSWPSTRAPARLQGVSSPRVGGGPPLPTRARVSSAQVFEHFADPLRALRAWMRVLRPGGALFLSVPWAPNTYDRNVPVSTIYDLALAYDDDADGAVLAPEAERYWRTRVETYDRLVDRENCPFLPAVFHEELQESVSCPT